MTRHQGFDVRLAPKVAYAPRDLARTQAPSQDVRRAWAAQERLAREGTRAPGAKKLRSLDLREVRAGRLRLYFVPVPRQRTLAIGAVVVKSSRRIRMERLRQIEKAVHRSADTLRDEQ